MSTDNQQLQSLLDGELADLDLEAVSGGGFRFKFRRRRRRRFHDRHHG